jgi:hypothetical protein
MSFGWWYETRVLERWVRLSFPLKHSIQIRVNGMKWRGIAINQATMLIVVVAILLGGFGVFLAAQTSNGTVTIFDPDANHIWNRTYSCLLLRHNGMGRKFGADALDPLLWTETQYLLKGSSHHRALACLDEFLHSHGETAMQDPLKRAILQRDLWAVFDWAAAGDDLFTQRRELESRLAEAIRRLALTPEQIHGLPNNYEAAVAARRYPTDYDPRKPREPFLPQDLFHSDGPWVCLSEQGKEPTALMHFNGRSRFLAFMRLPGGRDATLTYLERLRASAQPPLVPDGASRDLNLALPQFPVGTQVALVRQMIAIDNEGRLVPTKITESVQLRVYHSISPASKYMNSEDGPASHDQDFFEFRMSRPELFAGRNGGLVATTASQTEFPTFNNQGEDGFESRGLVTRQIVILESCRACHADSGIHSIQSRIQWMKWSKDTSRQVNRNGTDDAVAWETDVTEARKKEQPEFQLLQKMWRKIRE